VESAGPKERIAFSYRAKYRTIKRSEGPRGIVIFSRLGLVPFKGKV